MDKFLIEKQSLFHSLESLAFIWATIAAMAITVIYGYNKYRRLKIEALLQIKMFNTRFFFNDRNFFEEYRNKKELTGKDFIRIFHDDRFKEHLLYKEPEYYKEVIRIVENLRSLKVYPWMALLLFLGTVGITGFFISRGV